MNILLVSPLPPPMGGIAIWTKRYLESSQAKKNNVELLNISVKGKRIQKFQEINLLDEFFRSYKIFKDLRKKIKKEVDVVHLNSSCGKFGIIRDYICSVIIKNKKIKLVTQYHCNLEDMVKNKVSKYFLNKMAINSDLNLVLNKNSQFFLKNISKKNSEIIPNFITEKDFKELSEQSQIKENVKRVIYTGHLIKTKGCDEILEVAKLFLDIDFILVGNIKEEYKKKEKSKNVQLLGEVDQQQIFEELKNADIYLFPSHTEGFPNSLLEAMSVGLPIITTKVGAIPDMVEEKGALFVEVGNFQQISDCLRQLLKGKNKRIEMNKFNIRKVKENYLQEKVLERLFELYKI